MQNNKLEKIQEKMCNLIKDNRSSSYEEKLKKYKLQSLYARKIKHQLVTMFKMKRKIIDLCYQDFFQENIFRKTRSNISDYLSQDVKLNCAKTFLHV